MECTPASVAMAILRRNPFLQVSYFDNLEEELLAQWLGSRNPFLQVSYFDFEIDISPSGEWYQCRNPFLQVSYFDRE